MLEELSYSLASRGKKTGAGSGGVGTYSVLRTIFLDRDRDRGIWLGLGSFEGLLGGLLGTWVLKSKVEGWLYILKYSRGRVAQG